MGRIKPTMVKKAAKELLETENHKFNTDFDHNKKILDQSMPSNKIRNKIAGYITRLMRVKKTQKSLITAEKTQ